MPLCRSVPQSSESLGAYRRPGTDVLFRRFAVTFPQQFPAHTPARTSGSSGVDSAGSAGVSSEMNGSSSGGQGRSGSSGSRWQVYLLAARPKTLTAAVIPVLVGVFVSLWEQAAQREALQTGMTEIRWWLAAIALLSALAIQVGTNFFNDAIDFERGADTSARLGPARVTAMGMLSASQVRQAALATFAVALCSGAVLVWAGGMPILIIGLASLLFGYCYTGGPFPLAYHGLGDLFVLVFFGIIAVAGTVFLLIGTFPASALLAGLQIGLLAVALIAINNLRDIDGDRAAGKRTLAVRLGRRGARIEIALATLVPFLLGFLWWGRSAATFLPLLALPLAVNVVVQVFRTDPSQEYNRILARAALLHAVFGALLCVALYIQPRMFRDSRTDRAVGTYAFAGEVQ